MVRFQDWFCHAVLIAKVTSDRCKMRHKTQEFTPAFMQHCIGTCERIHATLVERLTKCSMGVNPNSLYYELLFWTNCAKKKVFTTFRSNKLRKIKISRSEIKGNAQKAKDTIFGHCLYKSMLMCSYRRKMLTYYKIILKGPILYIIFPVPILYYKVLCHEQRQHNIVHINRVMKAFVRDPTPSDFFSVVLMMWTKLSNRLSHRPDTGYETRFPTLENIFELIEFGTLTMCCHSPNTVTLMISFVLCKMSLMHRHCYVMFLNAIYRPKCCRIHMLDFSNV